jgi:hypothetical protein
VVLLALWSLSRPYSLRSTSLTRGALRASPAAEKLVIEVSDAVAYSDDGL